MKAILISIKPEWVYKILYGEKTIEVRKTKPKCELPIKVYIYCTKDNSNMISMEYESIAYYRDWKREFNCYPPKMANGYVIAEFTLNKVDRFGCRCVPYSDKNNLGYEGFIDNGVYYDKDIGGYVFERYDKYIDSMLKNKDLDNMCLTPKELLDYTSLGKDFYAWHIDDLKVYDKPKVLSEFTHNVADYSKGVVMYSLKKEPLKRPPQSWCYIQELEEV